MEVTTTVRVHRPRDQVFDLMADARNEPQWNDKVSESTLTSSEPIGQGTTFRTVNRKQPYTATITEYQRPDRMVFDVVGKQMSIRGTLSFTADGDGTVMTSVFDMQPKGVMKVLLPLMAPAVRKDFPKQMDGFRAFAERSPAP